MMSRFDPFGRSGNTQGPALRHRVSRIYAQIEDRHLQLIGVRIGQRNILGHIDDDLNLRSGRALDQLRHAGDQFSHVHGDALQRLPPSERQQPLYQRLGAVGRLKRAANQPLLSFAADPPALKHVEASDNGHQQVVEVVRYPSGKLTHRFQLLGLA